jgi:hypothetical protein
LNHNIAPKAHISQTITPDDAAFLSRAATSSSKHGRKLVALRKSSVQSRNLKNSNDRSSSWPFRDDISANATALLHEQVRKMMEEIADECLSSLAKQKEKK